MVEVAVINGYGRGLTATVEELLQSKGLIDMLTLTMNMVTPDAQPDKVVLYVDASGNLCGRWPSGGTAVIASNPGG
jgi:hypothetical protein